MLEGLLKTRHKQVKLGVGKEADGHIVPDLGIVNAKIHQSFVKSKRDFWTVLKIKVICDASYRFYVVILLHKSKLVLEEALVLFVKHFVDPA